MKRIFRIALFFVLFFVIPGLLILQHRNEPATSLVSKLTYIYPCQKTITYRLGQIDPQFNLSNELAGKYVLEAAQIWNIAYNTELFKAEPEGTLSVNFSYDERQKLRTEVDEKKVNVDTALSTLEAKMAAYEKKLADYKRRAAQLNNEIDAWNKKGGAPSDVYTDLTKRINSMNSEVVALNKEAEKLNNESQGLGRTVESLNNTVVDFNSLLSTMPEEGLYNPNDLTITIYVASNKDELISTLAHEFGHVINMDHLEDANSIMYRYANNNVIPTPLDLSELDKVCRPQNRLDLWKNLIQQELLDLTSSI